MWIFFSCVRFTATATTTQLNSSIQWKNRHTHTHSSPFEQKNTPPNGTNKLNARTLTNRLLKFGRREWAKTGHMVAQWWQFSDIVHEMPKKPSPSQSLKRKRKQIWCERMRVNTVHDDKANIWYSDVPIHAAPMKEIWCKISRIDSESVKWWNDARNSIYCVCARLSKTEGRHRFATNVGLNSVRWRFTLHTHTHWKTMETPVCLRFWYCCVTNKKRHQTPGTMIHWWEWQKRKKYTHSHSHSHVCIISVFEWKMGANKRVFRYQRNSELTHTFKVTGVNNWHFHKIYHFDISIAASRTKIARTDYTLSNVWWSMRPLFTRIVCPWLLLKRHGLSKRWLSPLFGTTFHFAGILSHHHKHHHHRWRCCCCCCCFPSFSKLNITQRMHITHLPFSSFWIYIFASL